MKAMALSMAGLYFENEKKIEKNGLSDTIQKQNARNIC